MSITRKVKSSMFKGEIVLGEKYTETIYGRTGVATAFVQYLTGCDQVELSWVDKNNKREGVWVDISCVERIVPSKRIKTGGPQVSPPSMGG